VLIVHRSVVVIAEDFVGLRDILEFDIGFFTLVFGDFVRVGGEGGAVVGFFDLGFGGGFGDLEDLWRC